MRLYSGTSAGFLLFLALAATCPAADLSTDQRIERLEKENAELRSIIGELRDRLEALENQMPESTAPPETPALEQAPEDEPNILENIEKRIIELEDFKEKNEKGWIKSKKRSWLEIGGEIELEYRDTQNESDSRAGETADPYGQFQIDHVRLSPRVRFTDDLSLEADFDAGEQATSDLQEAYLIWENLPFNSEITLGQHKRFFRPSRKTETYPLAGIAYWRDRVLGLTVENKFDPFYSYFSLVNGSRLNDEEIGEDESFPMVVDDLDGRDANDNKEIGLGVGWEGKSDKWGDVDFMLFAVMAELSHDDERFLHRLAGYGRFEDDDDRYRYGANLEYDYRGAELFGQYITSEDGGLDRDAWYLQTSYEYEADLKYLRSVEPLVRYGRMNLNLAPFPTSPLLWDREQLTFALIFGLTGDVFLRTEYTVNDEDTGAGDIRNNEALVQLELQF